MVILLVGILLWYVGHMWKRVFPVRHAGMGNAARGVSTLLLVVGILMMIAGFKMTEHTDVWYPPAFLKHINNLLVLIAIFLMSPAPRKGKLFNNIRHPMLAGFSLWAIAHLLVNGDVASIILFGGLLLWSILEVRIINAAEPEWSPQESGTVAKDGMFLIASLVLMAAIGWVHGWLGYPVFGG